jgi:hypothetical protein
LANFFFKKWKNIYSLLLPGCENSPQEKTIIAKVHSSQLSKSHCLNTLLQCKNEKCIKLCANRRFGGDTNKDGISQSTHGISKTRNL